MLPNIGSVPEVNVMPTQISENMPINYDLNIYLPTPQ
jgi:hypothetical protein